MKALIRAELLKMRTLRSYWWTAAAVLAGVPLLLSTRIMMADNPGGAGGVGLDSAEGIRNVFSAASSGLMLIIGILVMAGEFRHNTAASTFLGTPDRVRVVKAKFVAGGLVGVAFAVLAAVVALAVGLPLLDAKHVDIAGHTGDIALALTGSMTATALYALVGVGLGVLVRNQTVAMNGALVYAFVIEALLLTIVPELGRWLPGGAAAALSGAAFKHGALLPMWAGALVFAAYAAAFALAGTGLITRRDI